MAFTGIVNCIFKIMTFTLYNVPFFSHQVLLLSSVAWSTGAQLVTFFCFRFTVVLFGRLPCYYSCYIKDHLKFPDRT